MAEPTPESPESFAGLVFVFEPPRAPPSHRYRTLSHYSNKSLPHQVAGVTLAMA